MEDKKSNGTGNASGGSNSGKATKTSGKPPKIVVNRRIQGELTESDDGKK
jgi:hypothetical protein